MPLGRGFPDGRGGKPEGFPDGFPVGTWILDGIGGFTVGMVALEVGTMGEGVGSLMLDGIAVGSLMPDGSWIPDGSLIPDGRAVGSLMPDGSWIPDGS